MSDNKPEPVVRIEECDRETCREFLGEYYGTAQEFDDALLMQFAKHRTAAVARREAEIVGILQADYSQQCDGARECESDGDDDGAAGYFHAASMILGLMKKIQNGGGA